MEAIWHALQLLQLEEMAEIQLEEIAETVALVILALAGMILAGLVVRRRRS